MSDDHHPHSADTSSHSRAFDSRTEQPATAVLEAVEAHSGVAASDLPPLRQALDPDALNALLTSGTTSPDGEPLVVEFSYAGYRITVRGDDVVSVTVHSPSSESAYTGP